MIFVNGALEQSGRFILAWSWQAFILLLTALVFVRFDRQHRPVLRERVWCTALIAVLLLPLVIVAVSVVPWVNDIRGALPELPSFALPALDFETPSLSEETAAASFPAAVDWPDVLVRLAGLVWSAGVGVALVRRLNVFLRIRRISVAARPDSRGRLPADADWTWLKGDPRVWLSTEVSAPMVYGWFQPAILLPADIEEWSTAEQRLAMLRHECIHLQRRDHWIAAVESL